MVILYHHIFWSYLTHTKKNKNQKHTVPIIVVFVSFLFTKNIQYTMQNVCLIVSEYNRNCNLKVILKNTKTRNEKKTQKENWTRKHTYSIQAKPQTVE